MASTISAGVLIQAKDIGNFLLLKRSIICNDPHTWGLLSGGIDKGESVLEGLKREVNEEIQIDPEIIEYQKIHEENSEYGIFHYYWGFTTSEFIPKLDEENDAYGWFSKNTLPFPLYPKLKDKIDNHGI